tara:strand:- start:9972 stop:11486 length:1515 start_codon:yes stop_codon:yes gene_type:complete
VKNQLKEGVILSYIIVFTNVLVGLLFVPYLIKSLGKNEFGLYSLILSLVGYLSLIDLGFSKTLVRFTSKLKAKGDLQGQYELFGVCFTLFTSFGVIVSILALVIYFNVDIFLENTMSFDEIELIKNMILVVIFNIFLSFPLGIFGSILIAYERFIFQRSIELVKVIISTTLMILALEIGYGALQLIFIIAFSNILLLIIKYIYCKTQLNIKLSFKKFNFPLTKEILIFSSFIFLEIIMSLIYWNTGQIVIGVTIGAAAIAVFAVAIQIQRLYMTFSNAISGVFLPKVTAMIVINSSKEEISNLFIRVGRIQFLVISYVLFGFIIFGKNFIRFWVGDAFAEAYFIILLFIIPLTIPLIQSLGIVILEARNQMEFRSIVLVIIAVFSLIFQIILAKTLGIIGIAISISLGLFLGQIIIMNIYYHVKQNINIIKFWKQIIIMSISPSIVTFIFLFAITQFSINTIQDLIFGIIIFSAIYFPITWFFSMNKNEKSLITEIFKKITNRL